MCGDSVKFRCPGRKPDATPYITPGNLASAPATARRRDDGFSSSDESEEDSSVAGYNYNDVDCSRTDVDSAYVAKIGCEFLDQDDNTMFRIIGICIEDKPRGRYGDFYFKYHNVNESASNIEYTPCREILNSSWCQWQQTASSSARQKRAASRVEQPPAISGRRGRDAESGTSRVTRRRTRT